MRHGSTKFHINWLDQTDINGFKIGDWCTSCKTSKNKVFYTLCLKDTSIASNKGEKHSYLSMYRFKICHNKRSLPQLKHFGAMKTASSDYSFA